MAEVDGSQGENKISRREFLKGAAGLGTALIIPGIIKGGIEQTGGQKSAQSAMTSSLQEQIAAMGSGVSLTDAGKKTSLSIDSPYFPRGKMAIEWFKSELGENPESQRVKALRDVLDRFFLKEVGNFRIFKAENGASFSYTSINVSDFAKELYKAYSDKELPAIKKDGVLKSTQKKKEYIFPSFVRTVDGHAFTFVERAMQEAMRELPTMLKDIVEGRELPDFEIVTLGAPTNSRWGSVIKKYVGKIRKDPFGTLGETYLNLIRSRQTGGDAKYIFYGISMGGNMTVTTAKKAIEQKIISSDRLQILIDSPVVPGRKIGQTELNARFVSEILFQPPHALSDIAKESAVDNKRLEQFIQFIFKDANTDNKFLDWVDQRLRLRKENPIQTFARNSAEDSLREQCQDEINKKTGEGLSVDPVLYGKVFYRRGVNDPISSLWRLDKWRYKAKEKLAQFEDKDMEHSLGSTFLADSSRKEGERRKIAEFIVHASHSFPFFHKKEMLKWARAIDSLINLRK